MSREPFSEGRSGPRHRAGADWRRLVWWTLVWAACLGEPAVSYGALDPGGRSGWEEGFFDGEVPDGEMPDEELTDEEIDRLLEEYFSRTDAGQGTEKAGEAAKVTAPQLLMEADGDGWLTYTLPDGSSFASSVPCGMITSEPVELKLPPGAVAILRRDDAAEPSVKSWRFAEKGNYHIKLLMFQEPGGSAADYNIYEVNFYFTIIGETDRTLGAFPAPEGFFIKEVKKNGREQEIPEERCFFLEEDGRYEICCQARSDPGIQVNAEFVRDATAPFLSFLPEPDPSGHPGPVKFYPSEENCRATVSYNGSRGYAVGNELTAAGNYELSVEDGAGNRRVYHLRIRQTYDPVDRRVILAVLLMAAAAAVRLVLLRRDMRVL